MTYLKYALLFAPMALVATAPTTAQSSSERLARVVTHMKSVGTMSADFTQTDRNGQTLTGKLLLKRPGQVRFEYQKGVPLLIVADGRALTMVDYEVKQVQRWPIRNSPLSALLDPGQDLARFGKVVPSSTDDVISVEVRDAKRPEFGTITLIFVSKPGAPGGLTLNGWVALDERTTAPAFGFGTSPIMEPSAKTRSPGKIPAPFAENPEYVDERMLAADKSRLNRVSFI